MIILSRFGIVSTFAFGALLANTASAQQMTAKEAASAFGARERILDASLSPDGKKMAFVVPGPQQATVVQVFDLQTKTSKAINFADGDPMTLTGCGWVSEKRVLCTLYGVSDQNYNQWLAYSRLIAMDADGNNPKPLAALERVQRYAQQSDGYVVDWRDGSTDQVLLARRYVPFKSSMGQIGSMSEGLGIDLIDTRTAKVDHIESPNPYAGVYLGDGLGNVRIIGTDTSRMSSETRGFTKFEYRRANTKQWLPFSIYSSVLNTGMYPIGVDGKRDVAYVLQKVDGRDALYRVSLDGSLKAELAYANPKVDVSGIIRTGRQGRIVGATYTTEMPEAVYFDPVYEKLMANLRKALPTLPIIRIVDSSADEKVHLVFAASDTNAGRYYVFDTGNRSLTGVGDIRPQLDMAPVGTVKPITYRATDGTAVPGYLTLPPGGQDRKLPAIVMPHGGPASRDTWGFDWLAQFFVARGYAVLQPNFRGSSGYGEEWFQDNGFKSWKTAIGDVNDAGRWLVSEGIADPAKLAIVGWSYGGYAALQSNVLEPDLFKAVVAIAPVTDLDMLRAERRGFTNTRIARDFIGDGPHLAEGSPTRHARSFKAPVLMFHGDKDINVDVDESREMDKQLKNARKQSELVIYPAIDHQLKDSAVRTDMLDRTDEFLTKALKL